MADVLIAIPSRIGSSRLPEKPLIPINGLPLVVRVLKGCSGIKGTETMVLTDSEKVKNVVERHNFKAKIVKGNFNSGTERIAHYVKNIRRKYKFVFNVQGDEPLVNGHIIEKGIELFKRDKNVKYLTYASNNIKYPEEYEDPNVVKVICDRKGRALYFSRSPVPYLKNKENKKVLLKHIGIYGFKKEALLEYVKMKKGFLEQTENLEQLRILENGEEIRVIKLKDVLISVDVPEDVKKVERFLKGKDKKNGEKKS